MADDKKSGFSWDDDDKTPKTPAQGQGGFTWETEQSAPPPKPKPTVIDLPGATDRLRNAVAGGQPVEYSTPLRDEQTGRMDRFNRSANEFLLGGASGFTGMPETMTPVKSFFKGEGQPPPPTSLKEAATQGLEHSLGPGYAIGKGLYHVGKELFSGQQPGESDEDTEARRSHALGTLTGQAAGVATGEAMEKLPAARATVAEKIVAPLARKPPVATMKDLKYGANAGRAIQQEGLVAGSREGLVKEINGRMGQLSDVLDEHLQNHPNANQTIDAAPIIDKNIDAAVKEARKQGSAAMESRLEALRTALKTEHGPINGTPFEINNLKRSIGNTASDVGAFKATDPAEATAAGAMQDIYTDLKNAVNEKIPTAAPINERLSDLFAARTGVNRNIALHINKSPFSVLGPSHAGAKALEATVGSTPVRTGLARVIGAGTTLDLPEGMPARASTGVAPPPQPAAQMQRIAGPQMTLGLPPQNAPLFNIQVPGGPTSAPPAPPPTIEPIHGTQLPLGLPPEEAPLFQMRAPSGPNSPTPAGNAAATRVGRPPLEPIGPPLRGSDVRGGSRLQAISPRGEAQEGIRSRALEGVGRELETVTPQKPAANVPPNVAQGIEGTGFEYIGHKPNADFPGLGMTELKQKGSNISVTILDRELEKLTPEQIRERIHDKLKDFGHEPPKPAGRG